MGHHINTQGEFQSDRHPDLEVDKMVISFKCPKGQIALAYVAALYREQDPELAEDITTRLNSIRKDD